MPGTVLEASSKHSLQPCKTEADFCSHRRLSSGLWPSCTTGPSDSTALPPCKSHPTPAYGHCEKGQSCSQNEIWPLSKLGGYRGGTEPLCSQFMRGQAVNWHGMMAWQPSSGKKESASQLAGTLQLALIAHGKGNGSSHQRKLTFGSSLPLGPEIIWLTHQMYIGIISHSRSHDSLNH